MGLLLLLILVSVISFVFLFERITEYDVWPFLKFVKNSDFGMCLYCVQVWILPRSGQVE